VFFAVFSSYKSIWHRVKKMLRLVFDYWGIFPGSKKCNFPTSFYLELY
jgi:hypothetical protein